MELKQDFLVQEQYVEQTDEKIEHYGYQAISIRM